MHFENFISLLIQRKHDIYNAVENVTTGWMLKDKRELLWIFTGVMMTTWLGMLKKSILWKQHAKLLPLKRHVWDLLLNIWVCLRFSTIKVNRKEIPQRLRHYTFKKKNKPVTMKYKTTLFLKIWNLCKRSLKLRELQGSHSRSDCIKKNGTLKREGSVDNGSNKLHGFIIHHMEKKKNHSI